MIFKTFMFCSFAFLLEIRRNVFGNEEESVQSQVFVDKTLLIKEFFESDYTLITVPQGFGKTTNMDMIRRFCEIQVNEDGSMIPANQTKYFKIFSNLFMKGKVLSYLDVYENKILFNQFFSQHPVIHMDFTSLSCKSRKDFKHSLVRIINELFNQHKHLLSSDIFGDKEKLMFRNYNFYAICKELQPMQLTESVTFLASLLAKRFNKKVILLIDEVDSILHSSVVKSCNDTEEIIYFISNLISNVLNSNFTIKAILNSSTRLAKILTTGIKNIVHFMFTQKHPFNAFYGFTEKEVMNLAENFNLQNNMTTIQDWYNGYKIAKSCLKMYSFHSVSEVMIRKDIDTYSIKGKYPEKLETLFLNRELRRKVKTLVRNGIVEVGAIEEVSMKDVIRLQEIFKDTRSFEVKPKDESLIFDYMLNLGYFTVVDFNERSSKLKIKVPNIESKSELMDLLYSMPYFKTKLNLTDEEFFTINETLLDRKISKFLKEPVLSSTHVHYL